MDCFINSAQRVNTTPRLTKERLASGAVSTIHAESPKKERNRQRGKKARGANRNVRVAVAPFVISSFIVHAAWNLMTQLDQLSSIAGTRISNAHELKTRIKDLEECRVIRDCASLGERIFGNFPRDDSDPESRMRNERDARRVSRGECRLDCQMRDYRSKRAAISWMMFYLHDAEK